MAWEKAAIDFFAGRIPQKDDDAVAMTKWRWKSVGLGVGTLILAAFAANLIPGVHPKYAMAEEVAAAKLAQDGKLDRFGKKLDKVNGQMADVLAQLHASAIRTTRTDLIEATRYNCRSKNSEDQGGRAFWTNRLQDLKLSYQQLTGENWPDLNCNTF